MDFASATLGPSVGGLFGHSEDWLNNRALEIQRVGFGNPTSCADAEAKLSALELAMHTDFDLRNQRAFNIIRPELQAYIYQHCQAPTPIQTPDTTNPVPTTPVDDGGEAGEGTGGGNNTLLILGAVALGIYLLKKKKRKASRRKPVRR